MRAAAILLLAASPAFAQAPKSPEGWAQHDLDRPQPTVVDPGTGVPPEAPGRPPADAVVLFGGNDLSAWKSSKDGKDAPWKVENGYFEVVKGTGGIETKQAFGDVQLHIEWMAPDPAKGESQDRGNSGVFFGGGRYEIQVLDSYGNKTYPDGQAGAIYGQYPPLVNASRRAGTVAGLRHRLRGAALRREGQAAQARAGHRVPQRRPRPERDGVHRSCHEQGADALLRPPGEAAHRPAGPQPPGPLPQRLGEGAPAAPAQAVASGERAEPRVGPASRRPLPRGPAYRIFIV